MSSEVVTAPQPRTAQSVVGALRRWESALVLILIATVIFGTVGGIGLIVGPIGLWTMMQRRNEVIVDKSQNGMDLSFIVLLVAISISGLLLLVLRQSAAMGSLLLVHLSFVMTLFLTMPYGRFVHGIYRSGALLKWSLERSRKAKAKASA